jgi:hypothetical protein
VAKIVSTNRDGEAGPGPKRTLMSATFELDGQEFIALNSGPSFIFAQGISLSWQIIPRALGEMLSDKDAEKSQRVMDASNEQDRNRRLATGLRSRLTRPRRGLVAVSERQVTAGDRKRARRSWKQSAATGPPPKPRKTSQILVNVRWTRAADPSCGRLTETASMQRVCPSA